MFPGDPSGRPEEVINCRCTSDTRARWALDESELQTLQERAEYFGLDKTANFAEFKEKYLATTNEWSSADASVKKQFSADSRDDIGKIVARGTTKIKQGFSAFPKGDVLYERIKLVDPDGNKFDVAMHGSATAVSFGGTEANMSPRLLASIIRHSEDYNGQEIRLISCNTGTIVDGEYCFAEELANALGVRVFAPNDLIFLSSNGKISIGMDNSGRFIPYEPNERKRLK